MPKPHKIRTSLLPTQQGVEMEGKRKEKALARKRRRVRDG